MQLAHLLSHAEEHVRIAKAYVSIEGTCKLDGLRVRSVSRWQVPNGSVALAQVAMDKCLRKAKEHDRT